MRVYLDSLLLHSAILDALLLLLLARLFRLSLPRKRLMAGTLLAVSYIGVELFLLSPVLVVLRPVWPLLVVACAFGILPLQRSFWLWGGWHLCAAATAGAGRAISQLSLPLADKLDGSIVAPRWLPALLLYSGLRFVPMMVGLWRRRLSGGVPIYEVDLVTALGTVRINALWDSGNLLRVAEDGLPVLILHYRCLPALDQASGASAAAIQFCAKEQGLTSLSLTTVTYRGLGGAAIPMTAFRPLRVILHQEGQSTELNCWLGLSEDPVFLEGTFQAILPAVCFGRDTTTNGGKRHADNADRKSLASLL